MKIVNRALVCAVLSLCVGFNVAAEETAGGKIVSIGSDTMGHLMKQTAEEFKRKQPNVTVEVQEPGSSAGIGAMINGQSDVCPSSRSIKSEEVAKFAEKHGEGKQPIELSVALDGIVIYVHRDNPIRELSMSQLARIFCENPNSDAKDSKGKELKKFGPKATQWGDLSKDLPDEWKKANIVLYSRNAASGTYAFLKEQAMGNRDYDKKAQEMPGTSAIVNAIAKDKFGIGYGGVGYTAEGVRLLAISPEDGKPAVAATAQTIADRQYPIARALYIYISKKPEGVLKEYLNFILSDAGQEIIGGERVGFVKLPPALLKRQVDKLN